MSFWKKLFNVLASSHEQLSEKGIRELLALLPQVHTEILHFFEPGTRMIIGQECFIPNVVAEFSDPSVAVVYGEGIGHAFVRVPAVRRVAHALLRSSELSWYGLVQELESNGYSVKHIHYFACETASEDPITAYIASVTVNESAQSARRWQRATDRYWRDVFKGRKDAGKKLLKSRATPWWRFWG